MRATETRLPRALAYAGAAGLLYVYLTLAWVSYSYMM